MKRATSVIPIAFVLGYDPVATGLVASLARPGGNVTGLSIQSPDLAGKRLEILREVVSGIRRLAIMANVGAPSMLLEMREVEAAARTFGIEAVPLEIRRAEDIAPVLKELRADALYVVTDAVTFTNRTRILTFTLTMRVPVVVNNRETVRAGALMSYGVNNPDLFRRAADLVDKILRGARPGEIPVEQPTKFDLIINLTTAQALGVTIPESFLLRADEVIE